MTPRYLLEGTHWNAGKVLLGPRRHPWTFSPFAEMTQHECLLMMFCASRPASLAMMTQLLWFTTSLCALTSSRCDQSVYGSEVTLRAYGAVEREVVRISCKKIRHLIRTKLLNQGAKELACQEGEESRREFTPLFYASRGSLSNAGLKSSAKVIPPTRSGV